MASLKEGQARDKELIEAAIKGHEDRIGQLLGQGASAVSCDDNGFTALMWAARYDLDSCVMRLLPASDLKQKERLGRSALDIAMEGAGPESRSAKIIEAYGLALQELEKLGSEIHGAAKKEARKFRL